MNNIMFGLVNLFYHDYDFDIQQLVILQKHNSDFQFNDQLKKSDYFLDLKLSSKEKWTLT